MPSRAAIANETLKILERGGYALPNDVKVDLRGAMAAAKAGTLTYRPETLPADPFATNGAVADIRVTRETTMEAMAGLATLPGGRIGCLNFASAKNPGGGFLGGAQAQEESLARASGLYPCLLTQKATYDENRANRSLLYLDRVIYSPAVPFFRDDRGVLLPEPYLADVITCAAPNAGAIVNNEPASLALVEPTFARRAEQVLRVAAHHEVKRIVLGAWGCGVFRNDSRMVARAFAGLVSTGGNFNHRFDEIVFAVFDSSKEGSTYRAFADTFNPDTSGAPKT